MLRKEVEKHEPNLLAQLRTEETIFKVWQDRFDEVYLEGQSLLETKLFTFTIIQFKKNGGLLKIQ